MSGLVCFYSSLPIPSVKNETPVSLNNEKIVMTYRNKDQIVAMMQDSQYLSQNSVKQLLYYLMVII